MFELSDSELELLELGARNEAELLEEAFEARPCSLAHPQRLAAPPVSRLLDQLTRLVAAHSPGTSQLVGQGISPVRGQSDRASSGQADAR